LNAGETIKTMKTRKNLVTLNKINNEVHPPLKSIISELELIVNDASASNSEELKVITQAMHNSAYSLLNTFDNFLAFSGIRAENLKLEKQLFSISQEVEECTNLLSTSAKQKNIEIKYSIGKTIPRLICGDQKKYKLILRNLLLNAVELSSGGRINLEIDLSTGNHEEVKIITSITNSGSGISDEKINQLFKPFELNNINYNNFVNEGLGLFIARELCDFLKGKLIIKSDINEGSNFTYVLDFERFSRNKEVPVHLVS
jgi:signal transduction histidine kinase